jgi:hypothetical protein
MRAAGAEKGTAEATTRYIVTAAAPGDEAGLRELLRSTSMEGRMRLSFRREPDYFRAASLGNLETTVIVARESAGGRVAAAGSRALRRAYVDGRERTIGYLSSLRIREDAARSTLLARGYRFLRELHGDGAAAFYVTTILEGNEAAERVLTSGRAGLPAYVPAGRLNTYLVPLYRPPAGRRPGGRRADQGVCPTLEFVNDFNRQWQFAPVWRAEDCPPADGLRILRRGGEIAGTLALWDQEELKQTVVTGYSGALRFLRPVMAAAAKFGLAPKLPPPGGSLRCLYAAMIGARDQDAFGELLESAIAERSGAGYAYLLLGLSDRHPFREVVERHSAMTIRSRIYVVYWSDSRPAELPSPDRIPHLEIATL